MNRFDSIPASDLIRVRRNPRISHVFDVELRRIADLQRFDSVECHLVFYPYSRRVGARDFDICPYVEYTRDAAGHHRSAYSRIPDNASKIFGLALAILLVAFYCVVYPRFIYNVEAIIALFGVYFLGRDFWKDIEAQLISLTSDWRLSYRDRYYFYHLEKNSTLIHYASFAKRNRYGLVRLLPEMIDFISQSNSETVRMFFSGKSIRELTEPSVHLCSIHVEQHALDHILSEGFLFGVKMSFNTRLGPHFRKTEVFQSISSGEHGCISSDGKWHRNCAYYREVVTLGRLRHILAEGVEKTIRMANVDQD